MLATCPPSGAQVRVIVDVRFFKRAVSGEILHNFNGGSAEARSRCSFCPKIFKSCCVLQKSTMDLPTKNSAVEARNIENRIKLSLEITLSI